MGPERRRRMGLQRVPTEGRIPLDPRALTERQG